MSHARASLTMVLYLVVGLGGCRPKESAPPPAASSVPNATQGGVNDMRIFAAALVALPPPGITVETLPDPETPGAKKVAEVCSGCHNIPSPTAHAATDWPSVARRMWLRIDLLPRDLSVPSPSMADRQLLLKYLIDHSLKVSTATLPEGPGREAFTETCSRCHALPDPRQHSPADWPTVVLRMGERMDQMKVVRGPQQRTQELIQYLQRISVRKS
jgi:cytochrome c5